jgi:hypothetical protein
MVRLRKTRQRQRRRHVRRQTRRIGGAKGLIVRNIPELRPSSTGSTASSVGLNGLITNPFHSRRGSINSTASGASTTTQIRPPRHNNISWTMSPLSRPGSRGSTLTQGRPGSTGSTTSSADLIEFTHNPLHRQQVSSVSSGLSMNSSRPPSIAIAEATGVNEEEDTVNATYQPVNGTEENIIREIKGFLASSKRTNKNYSGMSSGVSKTAAATGPMLKGKHSTLPGESGVAITAHYNKSNGLSHTTQLNPNHRRIEWVRPTLTMAEKVALIKRQGKQTELAKKLNKLLKSSNQSNLTNLSNFTDEELKGFEEMLAKLEKMQQGNNPNRYGGGKRTRKNKKRTI